jgi:hypothetical protein
MVPDRSIQAHLVIHISPKSSPIHPRESIKNHPYKARKLKSHGKTFRRSMTGAEAATKDTEKAEKAKEAIEKAVRENKEIQYRGATQK